MTPADGNDFAAGFAAAPPETGAGPLQLSHAVLLHGGRAVVLFSGLDSAPPEAGTVVGGSNGRSAAWTALSWPVGELWHGLAVVAAVPAPGDALLAADGRAWPLGTPPCLDIAPEPLAALVRETGASSREVFAFLVTQLLADEAPDSPATRAYRGFARSFVAAAAEPDGFIEIVAAPDSGGLFAQGWSMSLGAGPVTLANPEEDLARGEVQVALFARDDILPPGQGFAFFGKFWSEESLTGAVFFETEGRLRRLDVVRGHATVTGEHATQHVGHMLPRLVGPEDTLAAFKRICRPRFAGADTLSGSAQPVAAAFDALLQAPDGGILALGWLLDPLHRVERTILKSTAGLYAALDANWCALPRPDLVRGFSTEPRFAGLLDERDAMHGFIAHAPASREQVEGAQLYLELVLDDGSCLFRPVAATPFESAERLPQILGALSPHEPELGRIVGDHLAPFLASVPTLPIRPSRGAGARPIRLGERLGSAEVQAVIPLQSLQQLKPILALIAGTPEAKMLDLSLVATRRVAAEALAQLEAAFDFFGAAGSLSVAPDHESLAARLDLGAAAADSDQVLAWSPSALPKGPGWLPRLRREAADLPEPGLISPSLTYEDGSIYYGGAPTAPGRACALAGYGAAWLPRGAARRAPTGAAEVSLIDREALIAAGGFTGRLFGDSFSHIDLADRLARNGLATWCSGSVEFWILDDHAAEMPTPAEKIITRIDAALLARRGQSAGDRA